MTTGEKIQSLRKKQGLTQEQLAQGLGVSRQAVVPVGAGRGPAGNRQPAAPGQGAGVLHRLAAGLGPGVGRPLPRGSVPQPGKLSTYFPPAGEKTPPAVAVAAAPGAGGAGVFGHRPGRAVGSGGQFPTLAWIVLVQGLNLCFWFYLLCLAVYALVLLIRYLKRKTS